MRLTTLILDDNHRFRGNLERHLASRGHECFVATTVAEALAVSREHAFDVALIDVRLPDGSGLDFITSGRSHLPDDAIVIIMTAFGEIETAIAAVRAGANDMLLKPFDLASLDLALGRCVEARGLRRKVRRLEHEIRERSEPSDLLGSSAAVEAVRAKILQVAPTNAIVLIVGETGTGKELVADAVHRASPRGCGPMVKANCSAISDQLLESELFGHERGAFTDAKEARAGLFEMAHEGTLFLDEISEMKPSLQAKLLRVIEGHPFRRIGGSREIRIDVRIVAASNRDLPSFVRAGGFREDLYYRLNVFPIEVPPLRERRGDVPLLARHFLTRFSATLRKPEVRLGDDAASILDAYGWPGNVRELRNVMERAAIVCRSGVVGPDDLPGSLQARTPPESAGSGGPVSFVPLEEFERRYLERAVKAHEGNLTAAARTLGIARNTLRAKLRGGGARDVAGEGDEAESDGGCA